MAQIANQNDHPLQRAISSLIDASEGQYKAHIDLLTAVKAQGDIICALIERVEALEDRLSGGSI